MLYTKENFLNLITTMTIKADIQITLRRIYNNTKVKTRLDDISVIRKMKKSKLPTVFRMNSMPYRVVVFNCIWGCFFVPCFWIETKLQFWKVKENCCYNLSRKHLKWNKSVIHLYVLTNLQEKHSKTKHLNAKYAKILSPNKFLCIIVVCFLWNACH